MMSGMQSLQLQEDLMYRDPQVRGKISFAPEIIL